VRGGVQVRLGDEFDHDTERLFLQKLRRDLTERSIDALIFANFRTPGRSQRQVDFLIVTDRRCVHLELKSLRPDLPLVGPVNGHWEQVRGNGSRKNLGNYYAQANGTRMAISDSMRGAATELPIPSVERFYTHFDCVLCIDPEVPPGSKIETARYVTVAGYSAMVNRLQEPGPRPPWNDGHWDAFSRYLSTYPESDDEPGVRRRQSAEDVVDDYIASFVATHKNLHERVPTEAVIDGEFCDLEKLPRRSAGSTIAIVAPSGWGKTHLAQHTAVQLSTSRELVIWTRADEYVANDLSRLLARAIAPYTTQRVMALLAAAGEAGRSITIFLDNFSGCPPTLQPRLIENLAAFRLRTPSAALIVTATSLPEHFGPGEVTTVELLRPGAEMRQTILESHGLPPGATVGQAFQTPYELKLAALCFGELTPTASQTDLLDVYIRRASGKAAIRRGLRHLAGAMDAAIRMSLTSREAQQLLERAGCDSELVDEVLASQLISHHQGRVRFVHELIGRLLAADHLVHSTDSGTELAQALKEHSRRDLREHALRLETDAARCVEALLGLAEVDLFTMAARGGMGPDVDGEITRLVKTALDEALAEDGMLCDTDGTDMFTPWTITNARPAANTAMLQAAAQLMPSDRFLPQLRAVLDHTDSICRREMQRQKMAGQVAPISLVVASTYGSPLSYRFLPAGGIITRALDHYLMDHLTRQPPRPLVNELLREPPAPGWGRVYAAALIARFWRHPEDLAAIPALLEHAWRLGGYHLQLISLYAAQSGLRDLHDPQRARTIELLHQYLDETTAPGVSNTLVEILAGLGEIRPTTSVQSIQGSVEVILEEDQLDPYTWDRANGVVSSMFEDERIIGPYYEAISALDSKPRAVLFALAVRSERCEMNRSWVITQLVELAATVPAAAGVARAAVLAEARAVPKSTPMAQFRVEAHVEAVRGWARVSKDLPGSEDEVTDPYRSAWAAVDRLIFAACRDSAPSAQIDSAWQLLRTTPGEALDVLYDLSRTNNSGDGTWPLAQFVDRWSDQLRELVTWGFYNRTTLPRFRHSWASDQQQFIVSTLAAVGDEHSLRLLRSVRGDPDIAAPVVDAIRMLEVRLDG
jgi:hypothetical protein